MKAATKDKQHAVLKKKPMNSIGRTRKYKDIILEEHRLSVIRDAHESSIRVANVHNNQSITIRLTPHGLILECNSLAIKCNDALYLEGNQVTIHGKEGVHLSSANDISLKAEGALMSQAGVQTIRAE
ncbi:MAG TPA: hypothetical protein PKI03_18105, partial [Pseudomonadota bacterium]|nr:hypothetical protein [Pseudomonadota bacterium]